MVYSHTAITVTSIEKSQKFYENVFGLTYRTEGERTDLGIKFIMLDDKKSGTWIELFEHKNPIPQKDDSMNFGQIGLKHIAFIVDKIEEIIELALQNDGKIIWPPRKGITVKRIAFISDPDKIPIELIEIINGDTLSS